MIPKNIFYTFLFSILLSLPLLSSASKTDSAIVKKSTYNPEMDQNKIMLLDAELELNQALLAGVSASLDTLNAAPKALNHLPKDTFEKLKLYKKEHDQKEMRTYLEYMRDSLTGNCSAIIIEKKATQARINADIAQNIAAQAMAVKSPPAEPMKADSTATTEKTEKKKRKQSVAEPVKPDTVIVIGDVASTKIKKHGKKAEPVVDSAQIVAATTPVTEEVKAKKHKVEKPVPVTDTTSVAGNTEKVSKKHAKKPEPVVDTVQANPVVASVKEEVKVKKHKAEKPLTVVDTTAVASVAPKVSKKHPTKAIAIAVEDTGTGKPEMATIDKHEIIASSQPTPTADSVTHLKSNYYVTTAQKSIVLKDYTSAKQQLQSAIDIWQGNYNAWFALAETDEQLSLPDKALEDYTHCIAIDANKPKAYYNMAAIHIQAGDKPSALKDLNKAIQLDPNYIAAYMKRGKVLNDTASYDAAIADFSSVLKINKAYYQAYKARGYSKLLKKSFTEAMDDFTRYIIYDQGDAEVYYYRGLAKIGNNDWLDGCLELSMSANMGYSAAAIAQKKNCE